ncbi:MAG: hypothetical protein IKA79_07135 [Lentisphaeria bacterium]|nr:hypothetical protein [Lentisphaeria bacterium]
MKNFLVLPGIVLSIFLSFSAQGEVFSLWPFNKGAFSSAAAADKLLHGEAVREERVIVNGTELKMSTSIVDADPRNALRTLKMRYPDGTAAMNDNGLLFSTPPEKGFVRKILIAAPDGVGKGVMFAMTVPAKGFRKNPSWPHQLPFPAGAQALQVIRFPDRGSVYGSLRSAMSKEELLSNIAMQLKAEGWVSPSGESGIPGGSGEIMLSADAKEIMIVGITPVKGSRFTQVSLYRRKLN